MCETRDEFLAPAPVSVESTNSYPGKLTTLAAATIVSTGALFYLNSFQGAFVFDDYRWIVESSSVRRLWPPSRAFLAGENITRPLIGLCDAINFRLSGLQPWSYHLLNLTVHIIAALALYGIVHRTLLTERLRGHYGRHAHALGLLVALIWLVHPLQTESVTYIIQRCESMMGMCYLVCLYCSIRSFGSRQTGLWYAAAIAACAAGMLSKQVMVTAPLMVYLYAFMFGSLSAIEILRKRWPLFVGLALTWIILGATVIGAPINRTAGFAVKTISSWDYFKSELAVIVYYVRLAIWPNHLCLDYTAAPEPTRAIIPSAIVLVGLGAGTVWALVRRRPIGFLGTWFLLILAPTSSFMPFSDLIVEHRMYLPLAAILAFVVLGSYNVAVRCSDRFTRNNAGKVSIQRMGVVLATVLIGTLGFSTMQRNIYYSSDVVMWTDVVNQRPGNSRAHSSLGTAFLNMGRIDDAISQLSESIRLTPDYEPALASLGLALDKRGMLAEAKGDLVKAVSLDPADARAYRNLGIVLSAMGNKSEALDQFIRAASINPDMPEVHSDLGAAFLENGQVDRAITELKEALQMDPGSEPIRVNLGVALYKNQSFPEAIDQLRAAISLNPEDPIARYGLGRALSAMGQTSGALDEFSNAIRIKPDFADAYLQLGYELEKAGRIDEARQEYSVAVRLRPDWTARISGAR